MSVLDFDNAREDGWQAADGRAGAPGIAPYVAACPVLCFFLLVGVVVVLELFIGSRQLLPPWLSVNDPADRS